MVPDRKLGGYRGILLAVGLALATASSLALAQGQQVSPERSDDVREQVVSPNGAQPQTTDQRAKEAQAAQIAPNPTHVPGPEHDAGAAPDEQDQPEQDSYLFLGDGWAQWAMAITGLLALILSGWAVWLLKLTLSETRRAVGEAEAATEAAKMAIETTEKIGYRQLRAYISFSPGHVSFTALQKPKPGIVFDGKIDVILKAKLHNTGSTPAENVRVGLKCHVLETIA